MRGRCASRTARKSPTRFVDLDGYPLQVVETRCAAPVAFVDLTSVDLATARRKSGERFVRDESAVPFDLGRAPLLRVALVSMGTTDHLLAVTCHHCIADGASVEIFSRSGVPLQRLAEWPGGRPAALADAIRRFRCLATRGLFGGAARSRAEILAAGVGGCARHVAASDRQAPPTRATVPWRDGTGDHSATADRAPSHSRPSVAHGRYSSRPPLSTARPLAPVLRRHRHRDRLASGGTSSSGAR